MDQLFWAASPALLLSCSLLLGQIPGGGYISFIICCAVGYTCLKQPSIKFSHCPQFPVNYLPLLRMGLCLLVLAFPNFDPLGDREIPSLSQISWLFGFLFYLISKSGKYLRMPLHLVFFAFLFFVSNVCIYEPRQIAPSILFPLFALAHLLFWQHLHCYYRLNIYWSLSLAAITTYWVIASMFHSLLFDRRIEPLFLKFHPWNQEYTLISKFWKSYPIRPALFFRRSQYDWLYSGDFRESSPFRNDSFTQENLNPGFPETFDEFSYFPVFHSSSHSMTFGHAHQTGDYIVLLAPKDSDKVKILRLNPEKKWYGCFLSGATVYCFHRNRQYFHTPETTWIWEKIPNDPAMGPGF